ncbi:MAG: protein-glutamate methylesterase/protein-glutamine glutaminase [Vicinamibacterales bacterium]
MPVAPLKVLVVDDSAIVRKLLSDGLRGERDIEVVGTAADPFLARDLILRLNPDVLTLDIEMPRMDGISFLKRLMAHRPMPVIIVSSLTQSGSAATIEALRAGAVDVIPKPGGPYSVGHVTHKLKERIRGLRGMTPARLARPAIAAAEPRAVVTFQSGRPPSGILAIGASTGGPQAIEALLTRLPGNTPPIVIVQHMPPHFTRAFAERLDKTCAVRVIEAHGGERLEPGVAYLAPGDRHMLVERHGVLLATRLTDGPAVHHQRPAVDVLFHSLARLRGVPIVALLLTGMGQDGADGMVALRQAGAETIAEDEHSCVVFGMPREAIARGGAAHVATLLRIPALIPECFARLSGLPAA